MAHADVPFHPVDASVAEHQGDPDRLVRVERPGRRPIACHLFQVGRRPAGEVGLRNIHNDRFKVVNRGTGTTITEMSIPASRRSSASPRAARAGRSATPWSTT